MPKSLRRVVTGLTSDGRSCVASDTSIRPGDPEFVLSATESEWGLAEIWRLMAQPETLASDLSSGKPFEFAVPKGGLAIRICQLPSESKRDLVRSKERFATLGIQEGHSTTTNASDTGVAMHVTRTVDFIIMLSGRMRLILEEGETTIEQGEVVIQRGTRHAWANPDDAPCIFAAIMIDADATFSQPR